MGGAAPPCHAAPSAGGMAEAAESASQRLEEDAGSSTGATSQHASARPEAEPEQSQGGAQSSCEASARRAPEAATRERKTETEEPRARRPSAGAQTRAEARRPLAEPGAALGLGDRSEPERLLELDKTGETETRDIGRILIEQQLTYGASNRIRAARARRWRNIAQQRGNHV